MYLKEKEMPSVPLGVYNLVAAADKLDDNSGWDQVCTLGEAQRAIQVQEECSLAWEGVQGRGNFEVGERLMGRISRYAGTCWKRTI